MDPVTIIAGISAIVGIGTSLFGKNKAANDQSQFSQQQNEIQTQMINTQQQQNQQRQAGMELSARRQQLEIIRQNQRAQALGINNAVGQGAQFSSGLQQGLGQVYNQSAFNLQGVNSNLEIGRNMFALDATLSNQKIAMGNLTSKYQTTASNDQAISSIGNAITSASPAIGRLGTTAFSAGNQAFNFFSKDGLV